MAFSLLMLQTVVLNWFLKLCGTVDGFHQQLAQHLIDTPGIAMRHADHDRFEVHRVQRQNLLYRFITQVMSDWKMIQLQFYFDWVICSFMVANSIDPNNNRVQ